MHETSPITMAAFLAYVVGVFLLAGLSHRLLTSKSFLGEYFLGSRGLGSWALAFTFAATSASGGSFTGYPSLIYSYGWILALWIASYMIVPLTTMGVMGKRLNQVARKSGAITIPDVLRDRFESPLLGILGSCIIIFFTICFMVAQFKAGALILEETFNLPTRYGYELGLVLFAATVIFYTAYGGFRAVVWTDVLQGVVMGVGVVLLIPVVLWKVEGAGGLEEATRRVQRSAPMLVTSVRGPGGAKGTYNDLVIRATGRPAPRRLIYHDPKRPGAPFRLDWDAASGTISIHLATDAQGRVVTTANDVKRAIEAHPRLGRLVQVDYPFHNNERVVGPDGRVESRGATGVIWLPPGQTEATFVFVRGDELVFGPGRTNTGAPFHPLGMVFSFFVMWAITGMGQPATLVRLMAFEESRTLKRAILTVTIYFSLIYLPLVFIFVGARSLLPVLTPEESDKAMVLVATRLVAGMGPFYQVLGAIFIAAPFAAVMSTVDSFLLLISSGVVRDLYQRTINPQVSERTVRRASYATTVLVGLLVSVMATRPPDFLQRIVVFVTGGLAATFLAPIFQGIFWKGMTRQGALAGMLGGFGTVALLFGPTLWGGRRIDLLGIYPTVWGMVASALLGYLVSKATGPAPEHLVVKYFYTVKQSGT